MRYLVNNSVVRKTNGESTYGFIGEVIPGTVFDVRDAMQIRHGNLDRIDLNALYHDMVNAVESAIRSNVDFYYKNFREYSDTNAGNFFTTKRFGFIAIDRSSTVEIGRCADYQHAVLIIKKSRMRFSENNRYEFIYEEDDKHEYVTIIADIATLRHFREEMVEGNEFALIPLPTYIGTASENSDISNFFGAYYSSRISIFQTLLNAYLGFMMNDLGFMCIGDMSLEYIGLPIKFTSFMKKRNNLGYVHKHAIDYFMMEQTLLRLSVGRYTSDEFGNKEIK